jgi:hypothetical protein
LIQVSACDYISKLIGKKPVIRFFSQRQRDVLFQFEKIIQTVALDGQ